MAKEQTILEINVDASKAIPIIQDYKEQLAEVNKQLDLVIANEGGNSKSAIELSAKKKLLTDEIRRYNTALKNEIQNSASAKDSIVALRAEYNQLKQTYVNMSEAERNANGAETLKRMQTLNDKIKELEQSYGQFGRNVGNYSNSILEAFNNTEWGRWFNVVKTGFDNVNKSSGESKNGIQSMVGVAKKGIASVDASLKSLLANPIVLAIAAVIAVLVMAYKAIAKNEESVNRLKVAMQPLQVVIDLLSNALDYLGQGLVFLIECWSKLIGAYIKVYGTITDFIGITDDAKHAVDRYNASMREEIALEQARRNQKVNNSKYDLAVAEIRDKLAKTDKKNIQERKKLLQSAITIEKWKADADVKLAEREFAVAKEKASRTANDAEANNALAEAEAKVYQARLNYFNETRKMAQQETQLDEEIKRQEEEQTQKVKEEIEKRNEARRKEIETIKKYKEQLQDNQVKAIRDEGEREWQELELQFERQEQALKDEQKKYAKGGKIYNLIQKNLDALNLLRFEKEEDFTNKQAEQDADREMERQQATFDSIKKTADLQAQLEEIEYKSMMDSLSDPMEKLDAEYERKKNQLDQQKADELSDLTLNEEQKAMIEQLYTDKSLALETEKAQKSKEITEKSNKAKQQSYEKLLGSMEQVLTAMAQGTKAEKTMKKVSAGLTLVTSALAFAKAVQNAQSVGFPANIVATAEAVAQMVPIISSIRSIGGFATGGYIQGAGTGTSDSNYARVSNGESILNARATSLYSPLLSALNQSAGGSPIQAVSAGETANNSNYLAQQFALALSAMPNPVVSVEEFNRVSNKVQVIQSNASF